MHYIKDIFEGKETEHAHKKFIRYSKGNFTGPIITLKVMKKGIKVHSSFHIIDELLHLMAGHLKDREIMVKGTLSWNKDLSPDLEKSGIKYMKVTKSRGIFKYILNNNIILSNFLENLGDYNILLSFKEEDISLSTKNTFPKPNKEISKDFCKSLFPQNLAKKVLSDFAFDIKDLKGVKEIQIEHDIIINDIHLPKGEPFEIARKLAKREGILKRTVTVNGGKPVITEKKFNV